MLRGPVDLSFFAALKRDDRDDRGALGDRFQAALSRYRPVPKSWVEKGNGMATISRYKAPALKKGLEIIELLAKKSEPLSTPEISAALDRSVSEIYRMLQVLEELGYISRKDRGFSLTGRLFNISFERPAIRDLAAIALPVMHSLSRQIGQSCHLAVELAHEMVVIAAVEPPGLSGFAVRVGYRRLLLHSASGRMLLAFQPLKIRRIMLDEICRSGETLDYDALMSELDKIVASGVSVSSSPVLAGLTDISAPILTGGIARAALTVPFVNDPLARTSVPLSEAALRSAALAIGAKLAPNDGIKTDGLCVCGHREQKG